MAKTIIKEIGIVLLLLVAVVLLLAIVFYDYIPSNKVVPIKIQAFEIPQDIEQELKDAIPTEQNIVKTCYIDNDDLDLYNYDQGKPNPFAQDGEENEVYIPAPGKND